jgi:hypothetical protein
VTRLEKRRQLFFTYFSKDKAKERGFVGDNAFFDFLKNAFFGV